MKKILFTVVILATMFVLLPIQANAAPFVVCDPYPISGTQPTYFELTVDGGAAFQSAAAVQTDNSVILHYDVGSVSTGNHNMTVKACDVWGCSSSVPFAFGKSVPASASGLRLSSQ